MAFNNSPNVTWLETRDEMLCAIRQAGEVYVQPRLGLSEQWVKISKREATEFVNMLPVNASEMDCHGSFGSFHSAGPGKPSLFIG